MRRWLRRPPADALAIALLIALWALFFWRLLTPIREDQASLAQGDFSAQFVTFAGYQYARFAAGEIPLWNPFNNGGLPFIADTQAAVFYPPRWITLALAAASGGWSYHALQVEMMAHVLAFTLLLYALVRRLTIGQPGSILGGLTAALVGGYSGFMAGYPPLQLALLEAAIWLPLVILGLHESTRTRPLRPRWLAIAGIGLGLSWLAGHPQTSYFLSLLAAAYYGYRLITLRFPWRGLIVRWGVGVAAFGGLAFLLTAVTFVPGVEYLTRTARSGFGYDAKGNGFPFQDVAQFLYPGVVSLFSPLHIGIIGLTLALIAIWRRLPGAVFWGITAGLALVWSFGANSAVYPLLYNVLPGLRFFRGQERAAYLVVMSLAILAGLGAAHLRGWDAVRDYPAALRLRVLLHRTLTISLIFSGFIFTAWLNTPAALGTALSGVAFGTLMIGVAALILSALLTTPQRRWLAILPALIAFELFTVHMDAASTYDPIPPTDQIAIAPPPLIQAALDDGAAAGLPPGAFRVDGYRGLGGNYGSLYGLADLRGISPLFLSDLFAIIEGDVADERAWELLAVRYVYSDWAELPVASTIITSGDDRFGPVNLHRLDDPRPFAQVMFDAWITPDALPVVRDPAVNLRRVAVLAEPPPFPVDASRAPIPAAIVSFAPEAITLRVNAPTAGLLAISLPYYPGWTAAVADQPAPLVRVYGALTGLFLDAGEHTVTLRYDPLSYRIGALLSITGWLIAAGVGLSGLVQYARQLQTRTRHAGA